VHFVNKTKSNKTKTKEISLKVQIFKYSYRPNYREKKMLGPLFGDFEPQKTNFRIGRLNNEEKRLFYFDLKILLPIQGQLLA
jgi:hypothetical protein